MAPTRINKRCDVSTTPVRGEIQVKSDDGGAVARESAECIVVACLESFPSFEASGRLVIIQCASAASARNRVRFVVSASGFPMSVILRGTIVSLLASTALTSIALAQSAPPAAAPNGAAPAAKSTDVGVVQGPVAKPKAAVAAQKKAPAEADSLPAPKQAAQAPAVVAAPAVPGIVLSSDQAIGKSAPSGSAPR